MYFCWVNKTLELKHWSSPCQLNLEPTLPNGFVGCKMQIDLTKFSVKQATTWDFIISASRSRGLWSVDWPCKVQCQTSHAHGVLLWKLNELDALKCLKPISQNVTRIRFRRIFLGSSKIIYWYISRLIKDLTYGWGLGSPCVLCMWGSGGGRGVGVLLQSLGYLHNHVVSL